MGTSVAQAQILTDANIFYHLEGWRGSTTDPHTTVYLSQIRSFQRQVTSGAFKIAGGIDITNAPAASRLVKQNPVPATFVTRIAKAFLDTLYAFLDGLVHLASDDSPKTLDNSASDANVANEPNPLELIDVENPVRHIIHMVVAQLLISLAEHATPACCFKLRSSFADGDSQHD